MEIGAHMREPGQDDPRMSTLPFSVVLLAAGSSSRMMVLSSPMTTGHW